MRLFKRLRSENNVCLSKRSSETNLNGKLTRSFASEQWESVQFSNAECLRQGYVLLLGWSLPDINAGVHKVCLAATKVKSKAYTVRGFEILRTQREPTISVTRTRCVSACLTSGVFSGAYVSVEGDAGGQSSDFCQSAV